MANPFVHAELRAADVAEAKDFYAQLFDWELVDVVVGGAGMTMVNVGEGVGGTMTPKPSQNVSAHWLLYVEVSDLPVALERTVALGGEVLEERTELAGVGWYAVIADPTGARLGLFSGMPNR